MIGCIPYLNPFIRGFRYAGRNPAGRAFFAQAPHGSEKGEAMAEIQHAATTIPSAAAISLAPPLDTLVASGFWVALQTRSRHEKIVAAQLEQKGVESYLPLVSKDRKWSDRIKSVSLPLFPNYVFARCSP